ncbi:hypothetical protein DB345_05945 [Spartobacteria bacterium LR76]|nr:hypothetical protein DB345_05945 [Spartobacteria bacterium LR76]
MPNECLIPWNGSMELHNVGWFSMKCGRDHVYCDSTYAIHVHQYRCTLSIGDKVLSIEPGDITVTPPFIESRYKVVMDGQHWCAHLSVRQNGSTTLRLPLWQRAAGHSGAIVQRLSWLAELSRMRRGPQKRLATQALETGIKDMLLWLHFLPRKSCPLKGGRAIQAVNKLVNELEKEYDRDWSIKTFAANAGMNANYIALCFRKATGCTVDFFLRRRRIEVAQHLLLSTTLRIKEIACSVGIADPQKFNKAFRSIAGCSPTEFRLRSRWPTSAI